MPANLGELLQRIQEAERTLDKAVADWRREARSARDEAVRLSAQLRAEQRKWRKNLITHILSIGLMFWLVIYSLIIPLVLTDLFVSIYQRICFPVYGITRVRRGDYVVLDRHRLPYLNIIEKFNCVYCGYANGVIAFAREVASRTEQYFCPIKHSTPVSGTHSRYARFTDYGDAEGFRKTIDDLRNTAGEP